MLGLFLSKYLLHFNNLVQISLSLLEITFKTMIDVIW